MNKEKKEKKEKKGFNWFALFMFIVVAYFGIILTSQQVHLSHVSESQYMADKRLEAAKAENDKLENCTRGLGACKGRRTSIPSGSKINY